MATINILKESVGINFVGDYSKMYQAEETPDGMIFKFPEGNFLYISDRNLPDMTKKTITTMLNQIVLSGNDSVTVNLESYVCPISINKQS